MTKDLDQPKWHEIGSILRAGLSWQVALRAERKSPRTIDGYVDNLDLFDRWLRARGYSNALESITADEVREWMTGLIDRKGNPARPSTVQTRYKGLRVFFTWAIGEGLVHSSPMANIKPPTLNQPEIPLLSDEQLAAILKVCEGKGFDERRVTYFAIRPEPAGGVE
jgi:site-specific recombinase XerD